MATVRTVASIQQARVILNERSNRKSHVESMVNAIRVEMELYIPN